MYWVAYQELDEEIRKLWAEFYIVRDNKTYLWDWEFLQSWQFKDWDLIETWRQKVDIVYDKWWFDSDGKLSVLNCDEIDDICINKWRTYEKFKKYCPTTYLANNEDEFCEYLSKITWDKKVIKPLDDEEGNWVFIWNTEYLLKCPHEFPILIQEFIDSSIWIPGIVDWIHDFRIAVMKWEVVYSFIRTPPSWEFLANLARWWQLIMVDKDKIPKEAFDIVEYIEEEFSRFDERFYWVDMAFTPTWPKIIELNSRLWLIENIKDKLFRSLKIKLAKLLVWK